MQKRVHISETFSGGVVNCGEVEEKSENASTGSDEVVSRDNELGGDWQSTGAKEVDDEGGDGG